MIKDQEPRSDNEARFVHTSHQVIGSDLIDENDHVNNGRYFDLYENARADYMRDTGLTRENFPSMQGLRVFVSEARSIRWIRPLVEGDEISVLSSAVSREKAVDFSQRILKGGKLASSFIVSVVMVSQEGRSVSIPTDIRERIDQLNSNAQTQ